MLVAYVSGHGLGHLTRLTEVLRQVRALAPDLPITVVGQAPAGLIREAVGDPLMLRPVACDAGLVQRDALVIDEPASAAAAVAFDATWEARLAEEVAFLRSSGARAVLADIPPLAFAAAARAGLPGLGLGNFSWDWIYRHLAARQPALLGPAARAATACREATLLLALPFAGGLEAFPRRIEVGLVARRPTVGRDEARRRLALDGRPAALLSFGGVGLPGLSRRALEADGPDLAWLLPEELPAARLAPLGLGYPDVIGAVDAVVTKPGYGIVSDAIGAATRLVYTERGDFPEYPILVAELPRWLPCVHVSNEAVRGGRLGAAVRRVLSLPGVTPPGELDGARRAAERVLAALG